MDVTRNILAGFKSLDAADRASKALQQAGFETVQVDSVGQYPGEGVEKVMNPITGEIPGLGNLTLDADFQNGRDASVLAAADPSASGMSDGGQDAIGSSVLLTAVVPENRGNEATELIRSFGGKV
ncbi:hypothetical protein ACQCN2_11155 [Brevibacillus ginsengisoli]|uniref:hypothetical protein n=1 Tax=Brevibacillus ginsengisoli TaxID=363854 RepID=UPI003CE8D33D